MSYTVKKKPWLGALLVFLLGPFGFLYYSFKKALVVFILFFLLPGIILYSNSSGTTTEIFRWSIQVLLAIYAYLDIKGKLDIIEGFFATILGLTTIPMIFINFFGEIVGGLWLLFIGEWRFVIVGLIISFVAPWVYSIVLLLQLPFGGLAIWAINKKKKSVALIFGFLSMLISHVAILFYVMYVADRAIALSESAGHGIIAFLLFGYGVATSPFSYMARGESKDSTNTFATVYMSQIAYVVLALGYLFDFLPLAFAWVVIAMFGMEIYLMSLTSKIMDYEKAVADSEPIELEA